MSQPDCQKFIFGSWALRGKSHTVRLIMEYLNIPYVDLIYKTPKSWYQSLILKQNEQIKLPYLREDALLLDGDIEIMAHVLKKYGHHKLLGDSIEQQSRVNMYLLSMDYLFKKLIAICCKNVDSVEQLLQIKQQFWRKTIEPRLSLIQQFLTPDNWFFDYITVIDFDLYQLFSYLQIIYPSKIEKFQKIKMIKQKIGELPQIRNYNRSSRSRQLCFLPIEMCKRFKGEQEVN